MTSGGAFTSLGVFTDNSATTTVINPGPGLLSGVGTQGYLESVPLHTVSLASGASTHDQAAGTYLWYRVSSVNDVGESSADWVSSAGIAPSASTVVKLLIPRVKGSGLAAARAYRIYRRTVSSETVAPSLAGSTEWKFVGYMPDPNAGDFIEFTDSNGNADSYNNFRPGTNIAPLLCRNSADLCIAQMSPLLKMPLAPVSTTFEYLLLLYHTLVLKAPERQFVFKNVGKLN
jgi:hypothetical protein